MQKDNSVTLDDSARTRRCDAAVAHPVRQDGTRRANGRRRRRRYEQPGSAMAVALIVLAFTTVASAHPGHGVQGFASGITHPVTGLDHVLAMIGVGLIAVAMRRAWVWGLPVLFVSAMVAGAAAGAAGVFVPSWLAETGIAASVFAFGVLVTLGARVPASMVVPMTVLFAVCHGSAHAAEMPAGSSVVAFFIGFVVATTFLHAVGIGLGLSLGRRGTTPAVRGCGIAMSVCGGLMLVGVL